MTPSASPAPPPLGPDPHARVVIVGAGHAGGSVAVFLRQSGFAGPITLLGEEPHPPYQRPPLSKAWLKGEADAESLQLKPADWYPAHGVELRLNTRVQALDLAAGGAAGAVRLAGGKAVGFDRLVLATGARARRLPLPGGDLAGVLALRDAADAEALKGALAPGRRLAVVGGGYVGLEAAASARALGAQATVIEQAPRVLARTAGAALSGFFTDRHRAHGVRFELGAQVAGFLGGGGRVRAVALADGRELACDAALVGVGAVPNDALARAAGLACDDGVLVDAHARTRDPRVWAVGDATRRPVPGFDAPQRLESVPSALEQARQAAAALAGRPAPPPETPWFWSDQYDLKLQIAGVPRGGDRQVVRGDMAGGRFAVFHLHEGRLRAAEAVNAPAEFMAARQLIARGVRLDPARLADPAVSMKEVVLG